MRFELRVALYIDYGGIRMVNMHTMYTLIKLKFKKKKKKGVGIIRIKNVHLKYENSERSSTTLKN